MVTTTLIKILIIIQKITDSSIKNNYLNNFYYILITQIIKLKFNKNQIKKRNKKKNH
jgi:hypothetical protein